MKRYNLGRTSRSRPKAQSAPWQIEEIKEAPLSSFSSYVKWIHHRLLVRMNSGDVKCLPL